MAPEKEHITMEYGEMAPGAPRKGLLVRKEGLWEEGGIILAGKVMQKEALERGRP